MSDECIHFALLASVFIIASCGLVYELIAGALSTYLIGDSITQFSIVIGLYLFAMGIGSYLSRFITQAREIATFIQVEMLVGCLGGFSTAFLYFVFAYSPNVFAPLMYLMVLLLGTLVGLEIPLVMRLLKRHYTLKDLVSQVLTFDYLGALLVSIAFPIIFVPHLGLIRTGFVFGLLNVCIAAWAMRLFRAEVNVRRYAIGFVLAMGSLGLGLGFSHKITSVAEGYLYTDEVVFSENTRFQRIVVTRWQEDVRLFLNGNLQFSSQDEYRYHEALVHPALASLPAARHVLVLGGGDGLAVREMLKYPNIEKITLVDLDARMTHLFANHPLLTKLNQGALSSPKTRVVNEDAFAWLERDTNSYDFIVVDFPDPTQYALSKLYTTTFYKLLAKRLRPQGLMVVQATSPLYARQSYWCVVNTLESVGFTTRPYHALVPSFGEWGYIIAGQYAYTAPTQFPKGLKFINAEILPSLFVFAQDMARVNTEINRLDQHALVHYYEAEWKRLVLH